MMGGIVGQNYFNAAGSNNASGIKKINITFN